MEVVWFEYDPCIGELYLLYSEHFEAGQFQLRGILLKLVVDVHVKWIFYYINFIYRPTISAVITWYTWTLSFADLSLFVRERLTFLYLWYFYRQRSYKKVMFSQASVFLFRGGWVSQVPFPIWSEYYPLGYPPPLRILTLFLLLTPNGGQRNSRRYASYRNAFL